MTKMVSEDQGFISDDQEMITQEIITKKSWPINDYTRRDDQEMRIHYPAPLGRTRRRNTWGGHDQGRHRLLLMSEYD